MNPVLRGRVIAPVLLTSLVFAVSACGGDEKDKEAATTASNTACGADITQTASTPLPSDVPTPAGGAVYEYFAQGATKVWYIAIDGGPSDLSSQRDTYDQSLQSGGYKIEGTDQEENTEAESEFSGAHEGTTNFRPLCKGKNVLRIKLTS